MSMLIELINDVFSIIADKVYMILKRPAQCRLEAHMQYLSANPGADTDTNDGYGSHFEQYMLDAENEKSEIRCIMFCLLAVTVCFL